MKYLLCLCILGAYCGIGYSQTPYSLVRAWGEPHIDSYVETLHQTCGAPGWRVYLSNPFMDIYVYNWQKLPPNQWTVMTQILVYMKDPTTGMPIAIYYTPDATSPNHPGTLAFPGGTSASAPGFPLNHQVNLYSLGFYRVLTHSTAGTAIVIGPKRGNIILSLNVYLPTWLAGISSGILIQGCPTGHVITTFPGRLRRQTTDCQQLPEDLREACEYDARFLGDQFATAAAKAAARGNAYARRFGQRLAIPAGDGEDGITRVTFVTRPTTTTRRPILDRFTGKVIS